MKKTLVFIGPMGLGTIPKAGDSMKNQLFLAAGFTIIEFVLTLWLTLRGKRFWQGRFEGIRRHRGCQ